MSKDAVEQSFRERAHDDVVGFASLTVEGKDVGSQMLHELSQSPDGMKKTVNSVRYEPREIAAEIRTKNAHAVLWNPEKKRYFFASEFHREAAQTLLQGSP